MATPPELHGEKHLILDTETTGLQWWNGDKVVGYAYLLPDSGRKGYLPVRHKVGPNLEPGVATRWLHEVRRAGLFIENANTRFDIHITRESEGVDLRDGDCRFGDVAHHAALLDDHRRRFNLEDLGHDFCGRGKVELEDKGAMADKPAWLVEPYAVGDCELVRDVALATRPRLAAEDLLRVLKLEEDIIPVVVEMEKNGTYLDMELLERWQIEATKALEQQLWTIWRATGIMPTTPNAPTSLKKIFEKLGLPLAYANTIFTDVPDPTDHEDDGDESAKLERPVLSQGRPSFTDAVLKQYAHLPAIAALRYARHLSDLKSKYLDKYAAAVRSDGWLRFNLHQLRYGHDDDGGGTVSGRFSGAGDKWGGYNPQQVVAVEKQLERGWCPEFVVRKLFKSGSSDARRDNPQLRLVAADMMQVEYRLFAHYANLGAAYHAVPLQKMIGGKLVWVQGPLADFHALVSEILVKLNPALNRKLVKNINFAKIYGAGLCKFALMIGAITEQEYKATLDRYDGRPKRDDLLFDSPFAAKFREAAGVDDTYNAEFPEVKPLLREAARRAEDRGFVFTLMGRRARLSGRFHSALNRIVQGGAADVNKRVIVEVYKERKRLELDMILTVHDELVAGAHNPEKVKHLEEVLNFQYFDLRVPILWDVKTGGDWAACK